MPGPRNRTFKLTFTRLVAQEETCTVTVTTSETNARKRARALLEGTLEGRARVGEVCTPWKSSGAPDPTRARLLEKHEET